MSTASVNKLLTKVRTELEILLDIEVIDKPLFEKITNALPTEYKPDMKPWGIEKLGLTNGTDDNSTSVDKLANDFATTNIVNAPPSYGSSIGATPVHKPKPVPPPKLDRKILGYCKSLYDYESREPEDLSMKKDDKLAIVEHLSSDWWKGYKRDEPSKIGVFPSNYVTTIDEPEFNRASDKPPVPSIAVNEEKQEYNAGNTYGNPPQGLPPQHSGYQSQGYNQNPSYQPQGYNQTPSYQPGYQSPQYPPQGYNNQPYQTGQNQSNPAVPFDPNYYNQQQQQEQQQQQQQQNNNHPHLRKYGSRLGNSIITGAGFTIGSDIVNSVL